MDQSEQEALKVDVLGQLYHATRDGAADAPDWERLTVTMLAYGGVTSVSIVRRSSDGKAEEHVVSRLSGTGQGRRGGRGQTTGGWLPRFLDRVVGRRG